MKIRAEELTAESFSQFGTFFALDKCDTDPKSAISFYPEKIVGLFEFSSMVAVDVLCLSRREMVIDVTERHEHTEEVFGGYNTDVVFHVAECDGGKPKASAFRAFLLPKGGFVRVKRNVWHHAPFVLGNERARGIVLLPPMTYWHDCIVVNMTEKIEIERG